MKHLKRWLLPLLLLGGATFYFSFFTFAPTFPTPTHPTASNSYKFDFADITDVQGSEGDDNWKVFLSLGDGSFWTGTKAQFDAREFTYNQEGSYEVVAEITPTYDDNDKPPKRLARTITVGSTNVSSNPPIVEPMDADDQVKLQSTRDPKSEDIITYILTYQNNQESCPDSLHGTLTFTFDKDILEYSSAGHFRGETVDGTAASINSAGQVVVHFYRLNPQERRNVFLTFMTKTLDSYAVMDQKPTVQFAGEIANGSSSCEGRGATITGSDALSSQNITSVHDPNHKDAHPAQICPEAPTVEFTVMFQNDGPDEVNEVTVLDEMDTYLLRQAPTGVSVSTGVVEFVGWETTDPDDRTLKFIFQNLHLKGTRQPGYGTDFGEEKTKATFTFRCTVNNSVVKPCNAVINQAQVFFHCNPPMYTEPTLAKIQCNGCASCSLVQDSTIAETLNAGSPLLPGDFIIPGGPYASYHWYPEIGLSDPSIPNPVLLENKHREYTLVASNDGTVPAITCSYFVLHLKPDPCPLSIEITPCTIGACSGGSSGNIVATAVNYGGTVADLHWQDCTTTGVSCTQPYIQGRPQYYFGVTDESTGCTAEIFYTVPEPAPIHIDDNPTDCRADLQISGGTGPYTGAWSYSLEGQTALHSATGLTLNIRNKTNVGVTVTDANGCTAVFQPRKGDCPTRRWPIVWVVAGLAIVALVVFIRRRMG